MAHADPDRAYLATQIAKRLLDIVALDRPTLNKGGLMRLGELIYDSVYRYTDADEDVKWFLSNLVNDSVGEAHTLIRGLLSNSGDVRMIIGAGRWADQGFPQIELGHKYASNLAETVINDPATLALIRPPWRAFMVEIPSGMFYASNEDGSAVPITRMLVHRYDDLDRGKYPDGYGWSITAFTERGFLLWRSGTIEEIIRETLQPDLDMPHAEVVTSVDERSMQMLGRIAINVCLAFLNKSIVQPTGKAKGWDGSRPKGSRIEPVVRNFKIAQPVVLNLQDDVRNYILHGAPGSRKGSPLKVQVLVRGHFKPKLEARLGHPVWIEPYWKGKEGAPILVTPKILKNPAGDPFRYW